MDTSSATRLRLRRRSRRRAGIAVGILVAAGVIAGISVILRTQGSGGGSAAITVNSRPQRTPVARRRPLVSRLVPAGSVALGAAVQDAAVAPLSGARAVAAGGLSAADTSLRDVRVVTAHGAQTVGSLPLALHDAAAAAIAGHVYFFGGGDGAAQHDTILRIDPGTTATTVGRLPAPSSDQAATELGGTAYVVGGYTGTQWLDTIVAWRPGSAARVVGRLPTPVRYAAVTAADGRVVVAGGSLPAGTASRAVYAFDPKTRRVSVLGRLPAPTTHASAAAVGGTVYVIGGRSASVDTPTDAILAVDVARHRVRPAGSLPVPLSDASAVTVGSQVLVVGGRGPSGTVARVLRLRVTERPAAQPARRTRLGRTANVYAADGAGMLTGAARYALDRVYVPNSESGTVDVIDPHTLTVVDHFDVGALPQHVTPSWDLRWLYVLNDVGNSLTRIDPQTGKPDKTIPVDDPYNMYYTPDGRYAIVVAERLHRLDFRNPHTFAMRDSLDVPCAGVDHMDFTAAGTIALASCEFSGQLLVVNVEHPRVLKTITLPDGSSGMPQDVKLSPDGRTFWIADLHAGGVWKVDAATFKLSGFLKTGAGPHGLYPSRDARYLYVTNRLEGSISVVSFRTGREVAKWRIPGGGSPDMGGVSSDGKVLWVSGRYSGVVYAISTANGRLLARIPVGSGPHGLCVWPQPGRHSLGHTGILR